MTVTAPMRALSVRQPWAWALAWAMKDIENRSWQTEYRGWIAIHASAVPERNVLFPNRRAIRLYLNAQRDHAPEIQVRSAIVAVARLTEIHPASHCERNTCEGVACCSEWAQPGLFHWRLIPVRRLKTPVPCKGTLGLWPLPEDVESAVRSQIGDLPE